MYIFFMENKVHFLNEHIQGMPNPFLHHSVAHNIHYHKDYNSTESNIVGIF